jgi:hypothetical protein
MRKASWKGSGIICNRLQREDAEVLPYGEGEQLIVRPVALFLIDNRRRDDAKFTAKADPFK